MVSLGCSAVLLLLGVNAAVTRRGDESAGCGLVLLDTCAVVGGMIAVLEVVMGGGRVDCRILNWLASCAFRPLCGRLRSRQSSIIVAFRAVSKSMVHSLSDGDDILRAVSREKRGWRRNSSLGLALGLAALWHGSTCLVCACADTSSNALTRINHVNSHLSCEGAKREQFLRIERFHRGRFLIRRQFNEIAFCSKDALKWTVFTAKRQLLIRKVVQRQ